MKLTFEVYPDAIGEWRWRLIHKSNGKIMADSGEGYKNKGDCKGAIGSIVEGLRLHLYELKEVDK